MVDTNHTSAAAITTVIHVTKSVSNLTCVPSNLVLFNEPFYLNSPGGEALATWSTVILFFYILLNVMMYNGRSCTRDRKDIQLFLTRRQKVMSLLYWFSLGMFEIVSVYGASMREESSNFSAPMTFFNVLLWCVINSYGVLFLLFSFCSKEKFRLYMWAAAAIQLPYFGYLIVERTLRKAMEADILITIILLVLSIFHFLDVPVIFRITKKLKEFYVLEVAEFSTTKNIIVPPNMAYLNEPLGNEVRNIQD